MMDVDRKTPSFFLSFWTESVTSLSLVLRSHGILSPFKEVPEN